MRNKKHNKVLTDRDDSLKASGQKQGVDPDIRASQDRIAKKFGFAYSKDPCLRNRLIEI